MLLVTVSKCNKQPKQFFSFIFCRTETLIGFGLAVMPASVLLGYKLAYCTCLYDLNAM